MQYGSSFFICTVNVLKFQTCSITVPVATFLMAVICGTDKLRCDLFLNMLLVSVGVVISSYGEIHFNVIGTVYQVTGIFAEALRLVLTQVLLQKKGLTLNPVTSLYYIAPCRYSICNFMLLYLFSNNFFKFKFSWAGHDRHLSSWYIVYTITTFFQWL